MSLERRVEEAWVALVSTFDLPSGLTVYAGFNAGEQAGDRVVIYCQSAAAEEMIGLGNFFHTVIVSVESQRDEEETNEDVEARHKANVAAVIDGLHDDLLADALSALGEDLSIYAPVEDMGSQSGVDGRRFIEARTFRHLTCATALAD